ncbi:MAG: hypothetical protein AUH42_02145 [Gemmatimonadetes bacterium 13_1_40CM_70_11]|nr:MAG: hypothetical protein AUH42_02145 [Gemmatimonadetes bacterium 13_1_40CM_70_11]
MDNLAHALVGAALGRAVADGRAPQAALVGAVAANAPDWAEFLVGFRGRRLDYYTLHRGITHSFLGAAVEIAGLTLLIGVAAVWWARRRGAPAPAWRWIALCVGASVLSHLVMDWQGSYGLRPWLPWSGRWYYGDAVAIVDPFFWLVPLVALAWGARRHWLPLAFVAAVGVPIAVVVFRTDQASPGLKLVCRAAARALVALAGYALAQGIASLPAKAAARRAATVRFGPGAQWAALTVVGRPFSWEPIYASADTVAGDDWALPRHLNDPRVQDALQHTFEGRAMLQFARFLTAEVDTRPQGGGMLVLLRDARYTRVARAGWAVVVIRMAGGGGGE